MRVKRVKMIDKSVYAFSPDNTPVAHAAPGEVLLFKTIDCFGGQFTSEDQLVEQLDLNKANPAAGPVYIDGAGPGDTLAVDVLDIRVDNMGFACSMGGTGPLSDVSELRTRMIPVADGMAAFNDVKWCVDPMIGVIGTAPEKGAVPCGFAADHGGNMDSKIITKGATVYFPVRVPGALLQMGDLHASMGDGEISGTGIEISGEVIVRVRLIKNFELRWPVTEKQDTWHVNAMGDSYEMALKAAADEMARLMGPAYGWDVTDIFIYLSLQGDVVINQGCLPTHDPMVTLRLGVPKLREKPRLIPG